MGKRLTIALAVFALVVVPLAIYAAGYFFLADTYYKCNGAHIKARDFEGYRQGLSEATIELVERGYPQRWMVKAFRPAAKLEGWLRGVKVEVTGTYPFNLEEWRRDLPSRHSGDDSFWPSSLLRWPE